MNKKIIISIIVLIVLLVLVGSLIYLFNKGEDKTIPDKNNESLKTPSLGNNEKELENIISEFPESSDLMFPRDLFTQ